MPDEKFEAYIQLHTDFSLLPAVDADGWTYNDADTEQAWRVWQASRAALLKDHVPMPRQCPSWLEDAYDNVCATDERAADWLSLPAYEAMLKAQEEALQQAGIEVKQP